jgi:hypothetical protein
MQFCILDALERGVGDAVVGGLRSPSPAKSLASALSGAT